MLGQDDIAAFGKSVSLQREIINEVRGNFIVQSLDYRSSKELYSFRGKSDSNLGLSNDLSNYLSTKK